MKQKECLFAALLLLPLTAMAALEASDLRVESWVYIAKGKKYVSH